MAAGRPRNLTWWRLSRGALLALAAGPGGALHAQEPTGGSGEAPRAPVPLREQVEARLVLVPVSVTDGRRRPVLGLGPRDFLLRVDGRPVPLASFDPPLASVPALESPVPEASSDDGDHPGTMEQVTAAAPGAASQPSFIAYVVDMDLTRPAYVSTGIRSLEEALAAGLPERTQAGLFVLTHGALQTILPFTGETAALREALASLMDRTDLMDTWILEEGDRQEEVTTYLSTGRAALAEAAVRSSSFDQAVRVRRGLAALASLSAGMARLRGRRTVVLLSEGLREQAGINYTRGVDELADETVSLRADFQAATRAFQASGTSLSPVSLVGLYHPGARDPDGLAELLSSLQFLARATGGRKPVALNDFAGEIAAAAGQPRATYLLGFEPVARDGPGTVHRIQVQVLRPRVEVTARSEYVEQDPGLADDLVLTAATLLPDQYRDLALAGVARRLPSAHGTEILVQLELPLDAITLSRDADGRRGRLLVAGLLRDPAGRSQVLFRSPYDLFLGKEPLHRLLIQEAGPLLLAGATEAVLVLWDRRSERIGTAVLPLPATGAEPGPVRISKPVILAPARGVYLLTPSGRPRLGLGDAGTLFLPEAAGDVEGSARLAMARVAGLPEGAGVRFCLGGETPGCVTARLTTPQQATAGGGPSGGGTGGGVLDAWVALDQESVQAAKTLRVEAVDSQGAPLAAAGS